MKKKRKTGKIIMFCILAFLFLVIAAGSACFAYLCKSTNPGIEPADTDLLCLVSESEQGDVIVKPQIVKDQTYLFLPSSADFKALRLKSSKGLILKGDTSDVTIPVEAEGWQPVDMTTIFGEMISAETYCLTVEQSGRETELNLIRSAYLPSMHLTLNGKGLPETLFPTHLTYLNVTKEHTLPGNLSIVQPNGSVLTADVNKFKGRGNTTWSSSKGKRPYNVNLSEKTELIPGAGEAKKWCLLSNNIYWLTETVISDRTGLRNTIAQQIYRLIKGPSAISTQNVDLYIDDMYMGTYLLSEKVEIGKSRIDIHETENNEDSAKLKIITEKDADDPAIIAGIRKYQYALSDDSCVESGGYLLDINFRYDEDASWFVTRRGVGIVVTSPEYATREQVQRIACYVQEFEDSLYSDSGFNSSDKYYADYIDMESWSKSYLLDSFTGNADMFNASSYLYVDLNDETGELGTITKGPAWDYDLCESLDGLFSITIGRKDTERESQHSNNIWAEQLLARGDFVFETDRTNRSVMRNAVTETLEDFPNLADSLYASQTMNGLLWDVDFQSKADSFKEEFKRRSDVWYDSVWSEEQLKGLVASETGDGRSISCQVSGKAQEFQWYQVNTDGSLSPIEGATDSVFTPEDSGRYLCSAVGGNIGYNTYAADHIEEYTVDGVSSLVTEPVITMFSNAVDFLYAHNG